MFKLKASLAALLLALAAVAQAYVTVKQVDGRWWFMDGEKRFFSIGADCVEGCYGHYEEKPLAPERKERALKQMSAWNFNSAGSWSSPSTWDGLYFADQIYPNFSWEWDDLYSPEFWVRFEKDVVKETQAFLKKPMFLGYFLSNEPNWAAEPIFKLYRSLPAKSPGSKAFVAFAKQYYKNDIKSLNKAWGTQFPKFEAIAGSKLPAKFSELMTEKFFKAWRVEVGARFYERYAAIVRRLDPDHLILGIRYAGVDVDFLKGVSAPFDAISVNIYDRFGEFPKPLAEVALATGKPCLITEWSFSSYPVAGSKSLQYIEVFSQAAKGYGYTKFIKNLASAPFMIGSHWFLYGDYDKNAYMKGPYYPDQDMGLVDVKDRPHAEFVALAGNANAQVEAWHAASQWAPLPTPTPEERDWSTLRPTLDGKLDEWGPEQQLKAGMGRELYPQPAVQDRYYVSRDKDFVYVAGDIFDEKIDAGEPGWNWECDYLGFKLGPPERPDGLNHTSYFAILPTGFSEGKGIGPDPYIHPWTAAKDPKAMVKASVKRHYTDNGYTFEAAIPVKAIIDLPGASKQTWEVAFLYHNSGGVYETLSLAKLKMKD